MDSSYAEKWATDLSGSSTVDARIHVTWGPNTLPQKSLFLATGHGQLSGAVADILAVGHCKIRKPLLHIVTTQSAGGVHSNTHLADPAQAFDSSWCSSGCAYPTTPVKMCKRQQNLGQEKTPLAESNVSTPRRGKRGFLWSVDLHSFTDRLVKTRTRKRLGPCPIFFFDTHELKNVLKNGEDGANDMLD